MRINFALTVVDGVALNPPSGSPPPPPVVPPTPDAVSPTALKGVAPRAGWCGAQRRRGRDRHGGSGADLADLCSSAAVRDAGLAAAGRRGPGGRLPVSYSRKVFIPVTHLCRDTCHYCTFVTVPGKLPRAWACTWSPMKSSTSLDAVLRWVARKRFHVGRPSGARWPEARQWLDERGYESTLDYVRAMSIRVLEVTGLLPHLNPGVMSWVEMSRLKPVAPSMGMMLETTSRRPLRDPGMPHFGSPDKDPEVRLRTLTDAGRLSIRSPPDFSSVSARRSAKGPRRCTRSDDSTKEFGHIQSDRSELQGQGHRRHGRFPGRRFRRLRRDGGGGTVGSRPGDQDPGPAQPGLALRMSCAAWCRRR